MDAISTCLNISPVTLNDEPTPTKTAEIPAAPPAKKDLSWSTFGASSAILSSRFFVKGQDSIQLVDLLVSLYLP
jgi:hypothetical protein